MSLESSRFLRGYAVLGNRNYRLFWIGQWVSLIGTWMQSTTQAWLLTRLTGSPMALGVLGAAASAPMLLLVLAGGVVTDRVDRRRLILTTQLLSLVQALLLGVLTVTGAVQPWHVIALAASLGAINAFDVPARQAFMMELVGRRDLPSAIALNATGFNVARVAGPAIGGLLIAWLGEGACFLLNAFSYGAVLWGLLLIRREPPPVPAPAGGEGGAALVAGVTHAWGQRELRAILALVGVVSAIGVGHRNFLPDMAHSVLHIDAWRYGLLTAAAGLGASAGALLLAGLRLPPDQYRRLLPVGLVVFSLALGGFAESRHYLLSLALLTLSGLGGVICFNSSHVLVQLTVDDAYRGRVMSLYTLMHQGTATFGSLALGVLAQRFGTPAALLAGAAACLLACAWFTAARREARRSPAAGAAPEVRLGGE